MRATEPHVNRNKKPCSTNVGVRKDDWLIKNTNLGGGQTLVFMTSLWTGLVSFETDNIHGQFKSSKRGDSVITHAPLNRGNDALRNSLTEHKETCVCKYQWRSHTYFLLLFICKRTNVDQKSMKSVVCNGEKIIRAGGHMGRCRTPIHNTSGLKTVI